MGLILVIGMVGFGRHFIQINYQYMCLCEQSINLGIEPITLVLLAKCCTGCDILQEIVDKHIL